MSGRAEAFRDASGVLIRVEGIVQDITQQRESEIALRESEQRARELIENANDIIYTADLEGRITSINQRAVEILAYSRDEMIGTIPESIMPPESARESRQLFAAMEAEPRQSGRAILTMMTRNGRNVVVETNSRVVFRDGKPTEVLGIVRDVTERHEASEALRRSERHLNDILDNIGSFISTLLPDGTFVQSNQAPLEIAGVSPEEAFGRPFWETYWCSFSEGSKETLQDAVRRAAVGDVVRWDARVRVGDGEFLTMDVSLSPIRGDTGEVVEIVASAVDITARQVLETQLRQSQKMEAVGQLAGGIAHDFNNILTVINGYGDLILSSMDAADPLYEPAEEVVAAARRAGALTGQLLAFSRHKNFLPRPVDLNEVVSDLSKMLGRLIGETITYEVSLAPDLPQVAVDPGQMEQVIVNLAVNARDAMKSGGHLSISTEVEVGSKDGAAVVLTVADTGSGMSAEILDHLFDPFFTTKGVGEGTGLGLATVYGIVTQSEGTIEAESVVGQGRCFRLRFPVAKQNAIAREKTEAAVGGP